MRLLLYQIDWSKVANAAIILDDKKWVKAQAEIRLLDKRLQNGYLLMKLHCITTMARWRTIHHLQWNQADWNEVFGIGANFGTTDPRDRIFALLGIVNRSADSGR